MAETQRRRLAVALTVAAAVLAISVPIALAGQDGQTAAAAPTDPPFDEGKPPSLPPGEPDASSRPEVPGAVKGIPSENGCPVDAPSLLAVLRASELHNRLAAPRKLAEVDCFAGYALARTEPAAATVIFRYTEKTDSWRPVSGGKPDACDEVPADVRPHLERCP